MKFFLFACAVVAIAAQDASDAVTQDTSDAVAQGTTDDSDQDSGCGAWASSGWCGRNAHVDKYCKKSCKAKKEVKKEDVVVSCANATDTTDKCVVYAQGGYCDASKKYANFMNANCAATCCEYEDENCEGWASEGYCGNNAHVDKNCKKACKKSEEEVNEEDLTNFNDETCDKWSKNSNKKYCDVNNYVKKNCKKSCHQAKKAIAKAVRDDIKEDKKDTAAVKKEIKEDIKEEQQEDREKQKKLAEEIKDEKKDGAKGKGKSEEAKAKAEAKKEEAEAKAEEAKAKAEEMRAEAEAKAEQASAATPTTETPTAEASSN